jgi:hypothetical protein
VAGIVDWELAEWHPEFWEYFTVSVDSSWNHDARPKKFEMMIKP